MKALEILKEKYTSLAFKELDKYSNGSAVKSLEIMNKLFREIEELNNRSCESCNYYTGTVCCFHEGWCDEVGVVHPTMEKNDCCNRYEKKDMVIVENLI